MPLKLGNIVVPAGTSANNTNTVVPFVVPPSVREFDYLTAGADCSYELKVDSVSPSTKVTSAAAGLPLAAGVALLGDACPAFGPGAVIVICVFNGGGAPETVEVWASKFA